MMMKNNRLAIQ